MEEIGSFYNTDSRFACFVTICFLHFLFVCLFHTESMGAMGNAFVACGVIYCTDSYIANPTTINYAYDTKTGTQWNPSIQFTSEHTYNYMLDYNPRERVLYAWDNWHPVTYSLTMN